MTAVAAARSALAQAASVQCAPHAWGTAIGLAATLHFIASLPDSPPCLVPIPPLLEFEQKVIGVRCDPAQLLERRVVADRDDVAIAQQRRRLLRKSGAQERQRLPMLFDPRVHLAPVVDRVLEMRRQMREEGHYEDGDFGARAGNRTLNMGLESRDDSQ